LESREIPRTIALPAQRVIRGTLSTVKAKETILLLSGVLFFASLILPALQPTPLTGGVGHIPLFGYQVLAFGWLAILTGMFSPLANLLAIGCLIYIQNKKYMTGLILSIVALLVSLEFIGDKLFNNGTLAGDHFGLLIGFYAWQVSFVFLVIYCYLKYKEAAAR
jgi:hypothetical protein